MAVGDVVNNITNIAAAASLTYQPVAGVETLITGVSSDQWVGASPNGSYFIDVYCFAGAIGARYSTVAGQKIVTNLKLLISNGFRLVITNRAGGNANLAYWGVQTK